MGGVSLGFRFNLGFGVYDSVSAFRAWGLEFRVEDVGYGFRAWGVGCRV